MARQHEIDPTLCSLLFCDEMLESAKKKKAAVVAPKAKSKCSANQSWLKRLVV